MTKKTVCNVCGKEKGEVNHWWLYIIHHVLSDEEFFSLEVRPWVENDVDFMKHACGQECVVKAVNSYLSEAAKLR